MLMLHVLWVMYCWVAMMSLENALLPYWPCCVVVEKVSYVLMFEVCAVWRSRREDHHTTNLAWTLGQRLNAELPPLVQCRILWLLMNKSLHSSSDPFLSTSLNSIQNGRRQDKSRPTGPQRGSDDSGTQTPSASQTPRAQTRPCRCESLCRCYEFHAGYAFPQLSR